MVLPLRLVEKFTFYKLKLLVLGAWLIAAIIAILPAFGWSSYVIEPIGSYSGPKWNKSIESISYMGLVLICAFVSPQIFIFVTNLLVWKKVDDMRNFEQRKFFKLFIVLSMISFDVCWGPYAICGTLRLLTSMEIPEKLLYVCGGFSKFSVVLKIVIFVILKRDCRSLILRYTCIQYFIKQDEPQIV